MNLRLMNLCLALIWLTLGLALLGEEWTTGRPRWVIPVGGGVSVAWLAVVLGVYNLVRWWLLGYRERARTPTRSSLEQPLKRTAEERQSDEYNPDLDFSRPLEPPNSRPEQ
jgi:hypothetical protein